MMYRIKIPAEILVEFEADNDEAALAEGRRIQAEVNEYDNPLAKDILRDDDGNPTHEARVWPTMDEVEIDERWHEDIELRPIRVTLDHEVAFDGFTYGELWNGFECPYFTKEVADQILEYFKTTGQPNCRYNAEADVYVFYHEDGCEDEPDYFGITSKNGMYAIGAWGWAWVEVDARTEARHHLCTCDTDHASQDCPFHGWDLQTNEEED
jgi:hypothetical protein